MAIFCTSCGQDNSETSQFCSKCGQPLGASLIGASSGSPMSGSSLTGSPMNPSGSPFPPPLPSSTADPNAQTDGKAIASLVLGILSLTIFSIFAGIPAVILGHVSRSNIKKSMGRLKGEGVALAGLIMGYISFLAIPFIILIIAAIAIPNLLRARISANESAAIEAVRDINTAAVSYQERDQRRSFPSDLKQLRSADHAGQISREVADGRKSGYAFAYTPQDTEGDQVVDGYFVVAIPLTPGSTGQRSFCSDQTGVIRSADKNDECTLASSPV